MLGHLPPLVGVGLGGQHLAEELLGRDPQGQGQAVVPVVGEEPVKSPPHGVGDGHLGGLVPGGGGDEAGLAGADQDGVALVQHPGGQHVPVEPL